MFVSSMCEQMFVALIKVNSAHNAVEYVGWPQWIPSREILHNNKPLQFYSDQRASTVVGGHGKIMPCNENVQFLKEMYKL